MDRIIEKQRDLEIYGNYDVVVCGGSITGISAALAAARTGAKTLLISLKYACFNNSFLNSASTYDKTYLRRI